MSTPAAVSSQVSPSHSTSPRAAARPAIARSSVVLPAPDGPATARHAPEATSSSTSSSATRSTGGDLDGDEDGGAHREQDDGERDRAVEVGGKALVEGERCCLRDPAKGAGEHQRRSEFTERSPPCQRGAGEQAVARQ